MSCITSYPQQETKRKENTSVKEDFECIYKKMKSEVPLLWCWSSRRSGWRQTEPHYSPNEFGLRIPQMLFSNRNIFIFFTSVCLLAPYKIFRTPARFETRAFFSSMMFTFAMFYDSLHKTYTRSPQ